jgi:hypothetical protein
VTSTSHAAVVHAHLLPKQLVPPPAPAAPPAP